MVANYSTLTLNLRAKRFIVIAARFLAAMRPNRSLISELHGWFVQPNRTAPVGLLLADDYFYRIAGEDWGQHRSGAIYRIKRSELLATAVASR